MHAWFTRLLCVHLFELGCRQSHPIIRTCNRHPRSFWTTRAPRPLLCIPPSLLLSSSSLPLAPHLSSYPVRHCPLHLVLSSPIVCRSEVLLPSSCCTVPSCTVHRTVILYRGALPLVILYYPILYCHPKLSHLAKCCSGPVVLLPYKPALVSARQSNDSQAHHAALADRAEDLGPAGVGGGQVDAVFVSLHQDPGVLVDLPDVAGAGAGSELCRFALDAVQANDAGRALTRVGR